MENKIRQTFIKGENIELWALTVENVELYAKWVNSHNGRIYSRVPLPQRISELKKLLEPKPEFLVQTNIYLEIYHKKDQKPIGIVGLLDIDWLNRKGKVSIVIGESEYWGQEIAGETLKLLFAYAFEDLNLHKLYAVVYTPNHRSTRVFEKLGLSVEATLKEEVYVDGKYLDANIYCIYKKKWLSKNN
ncbi:MAG: GNAT family protein [Candidatus Lokiarchaeota archaeon]|jgi:RimJ/RimL family protein N-acetyltransferase